MERRTTLAVALVFFVLAAGVVLGVVSVSGGGGTLTEQWVSDTARDTLGNHHAPTAGRTGNRTLVVAPVNAPRTVGNCALVTFTTNTTEVWRATMPEEACNIHAFGDPTVADLDRDGDREVAVATTEELVHVYDLQTGDAVFSRELPGWGYAAPVVTDFTPAPGRELLVADLSGGVVAFADDGTRLWSRNLSGTVAPIFVEDFDASGDAELAVGEGKNVTFLESDGSTAYQTAVGGSVTWTTEGQADDDPALEVVAATTNGRVVAVDGRSGDVQWVERYNTMAAVYAFGDGDRDGQAEVYAVAQDGKLRALDASDGTEKWTTTLTTEDVQMMPPPALGDLDGDGVPELVAVTQDGVVSVVDPKSGAVVDSYERDVPIWMRPTLADLDGDGSKEILVVYGDARVVALSYSEK
ncbi:PQQ-binding-like beta-propeller repeat protein [Halospeciosus flavus]|uniref:PQQ-binding-like beta-propeller repeat protein n=1 Tax=Halospeciosus flavus TaxID=3032283 RepID=A0ABD5Z6S3_9EURY|nr:PQQ-binding-like beta-propeller repeat protein [Halospeciosus flavus]